jgi:hypothetical protein
MNGTDDLISLSEAASYLGMTHWCLRKIVARSRRAALGDSIRGATITFFQASPHSSIKFRREWLDAYIDAGKVTCPREVHQQKKATREKQAAMRTVGEVFAQYATLA